MSGGRRTWGASAAVALTVCAMHASAAGAALNGPATPPPKGCNPVAVSDVLPSATEICVHRLLVTETTASQEQNRTLFTATDHVGTLTARVPNWWPSGGPAAGMIITMWGKLKDGVFEVHRWVDLTHGTGPAPDGPYAEMRLLDVSKGTVLPEHRMVWVRATTFLLDPQETGDGDIHVQTLSPCPAAGLTTETTPPMRGYVDHPISPTDTGSTSEADGPSRHLEDAPPVGVPVMVLGATRYDYGFGWWELHPIRAWRFLTPTEHAQQAADCAADPGPHLDPSGPLPAPFGFPPCTDDSEFGNPGGIFSPCGPRCYVAHTAVDQPEQLAGSCAGISPIVTRSQEKAPETTPGSTGISATQAPQHSSSQPSNTQPSKGAVSSAGLSQAALLARYERIYGSKCKPLRRLHGRRSRAYRLCLLALARLAGSETRNPRFACRKESHVRTRKRRKSDFDLCVAAGRLLLANRHIEAD